MTGRFGRLLTRTLACVALTGQLLVAQQPARHATPANATTPALAAPESVGVSAERLDRLHAGMQAFVDRHEAGGIVTLLARGGKIVDLHAYRLAGRREPDADEDRYALPHRVDEQADHQRRGDDARGGRQARCSTDPVSKYIPAFKGHRVIAEGGTTRTPARRDDYHPRSAVASLGSELWISRQRSCRRCVSA